MFTEKDMIEKLGENYATEPRRSQEAEEANYAKNIVDKGYTPNTFGYGAVARFAGTTGLDFGLLPTFSKTYGNDTISEYLEETPMAIEDFIFSQNEGLRPFLRKKQQELGPIEFIKTMVRAKYMNVPELVFDPKRERKLLANEPSYFAVNQRRINALHKTADYSQGPGGRNIFNPEESFLTEGQRYKFAGLTGQQRENFLNDFFNEETGFKVISVPIELDEKGNVEDSEFLIQRLNQVGVPVETRRVDPFGEEEIDRHANLMAELLTTKILIDGEGR